MKRIILIFTIIIANQILFSQSHLETTFTTEGIETVINTTDLLINEPISNKIIEKKNKKIFDFQTTSDLGMKIGVETVVNETGKSVSLPLSFSYSKFDFSASVPYFFSKKLNYSLETAETSGIGDISLGIGYCTVLAEVSYYIHFDTKLPTGDDGNLEDGYLVPLGTGSTDFMIFLSGHKFLSESIAIGGNIFYKYNGSSSKKAEIIRYDNPDENDITTDIESVDYTITNGNFLSFDANFEYFFGYGFSLNTLFSFRTIGEGNTDKEHSYNWNRETEELTGLSNKQDVSMFDISAIASFGISIIDVSVGLKVPVYTKRHDDNLEEDRGITMVLKLDYTLF